MLQKGTREYLTQLGTERVSIEQLLSKAEAMERSWRDDIISGTTRVPITLTEDLKAEYVTCDGRPVSVDLTENAFSQLCGRAGIPVRYMKDLFEQGDRDLAVENYIRMSQKLVSSETVLRSRVYEDTARAVLTDEYHPFDNSRILEGVWQAASGAGYEANQAFLSPDKLHIRFVDFENPLKVRRGLFPGFTVSSSNIGDGAFVVRYFLFRFACRNGIVHDSGVKGVVIRQTHVKAFDAPASLFLQAFSRMADFNEIYERQIGKAAGKKLDKTALESFFKEAQKELHLGDRGLKEVRGLIGKTYDPTVWGVVNAFTEAAQSDRYGLDRRIEIESYASKLLQAV